MTHQKQDISTILQSNGTIRTLYNAVLQYLESLGPVQAFPHKTQVSFGGEGVKTYFAFVWLPQTINNSAPEDSITLTIDLPRRVSHPRIKESVKLREGRWTHHVLIEKKSDLDADVRAWLRESYEFGKVGLRQWRKDHLD